ncbi:hypothetical protein [Flavobacterium sp. JAS]|uniref:hypothetical protein n=1 Tax=Flavobacterium sp. JAS TaxID=2897329 RepID=UPI001E425356|nr:hypothetical protein [Flavobacterium sp. JAS]MCD0470690.1 hypothetical protein [Flavobacterium sp. JAS]
MKNLLLLFSALSLVLTSCSNDDNNSSSEDTSILPKTISYIYPSAMLGTNNTSVITYSGNKIVSTVDENSKTIFTYDGNLITKQVKFDLDSKGVETKDAEVSYTYENGKLKTRILKESFSTEYPNGEYIYKTVYTYTSANLISYVNYSVNVNTQAESKRDEGSLTFKDGNLVKEQQISGSLISTRTYEYDAKNNPLKNVLGFDLLLNEISEFGKNNSTKTTSISSGNSTPTNYLTTYTYNDKDYPLRHTSFAGDGKSIEYEIEYTY